MNAPQVFSQTSGHPGADASPEKAAIYEATKAYDEFFKKLNNKNRIALQKLLGQETTIEGMMKSVQNAYDKRKKEASFKLLGHLQKHTGWLQNVFNTIDAVVQANTGITCSIWTPLNICLKISNHHALIINQIIDMIDTIEQTVHHIEIYKKLQPNAILNTALLRVFTDIVHFCFITLRFFEHSTLVRLFKLFVSPVKKKFQGVIDDLRHHVQYLDSTAKIVDMAEGVQFRIESRLEKWLKTLDPPKMKQKEEDTVKDRVEGTCAWILSQNIFKAWMTSQKVEERLLCVSGKSGCGKTFLAASVIESLAAKSPAAEDKQVIYLFFSEKGKTFCKPEDALVRSSLSQILIQAKNGNKLEALLDQMDKIFEPTTEDLWKIVLEATNHRQGSTFWVIDGFDELDGTSPSNDGGIKNLMKYFLELLNSQDSSRVMILGRPHAFKAVKEEEFPHLSIAINDKMIEKDLEKFIQVKIRESSFLGQEAQAKHRHDFSKIIFQKAEGTFLWVKLVMDNTPSWSSVKEVRYLLENLPNGVKALYNEMLRRLDKNVGSYDAKIAKHIFGFLAAAGRPLEVEELRYAQGMACWLEKTPQEGTLEDCLIYEPEKKFLQACGGFVHIQNGKVSFVHLSAKEYLLDIATGTNIKVDLLTSHRQFGDVCLKYLILFGDKLSLDKPTSTSLMTAASPLPVMEYATSYLIHHLNKSGALCENAQGLMAKFIRENSFVNWIKEFLKLCFNFGFLQDMTEDLTAFVEWMSSDSLGGEILDITISTIRSQLNKTTEDTDSHPQGDRILEIFHTVFGMLYNEQTDEVSMSNLNSQEVVDNHKTIALGADQSIHDIAKYFDKNKKLPVALTLNVLAPLRTFRKAFIDPLNKLSQFITMKSAELPIIFLIGAGWYYLELGRNEESLPIITKAKEKLSENDKYDNTVFKFWVGVALVQLWEPEDGEKLLREVVFKPPSIKRNFFNLRWDMYWLGHSLFDQKKYIEAEEVFRRGAKKGSGPRETIIVNTYWAARSLFCRKTYKDAAPIFATTALNMTKIPSIKTSLNQQHCGLFAGVTLYFLNDYNEAEILLKRHLNYMEKSFGNTTEQTMNTAVWLGRVLKLQGKYLEAEMIFRPVIQKLRDSDLFDTDDKFSTSLEGSQASDYTNSYEDMYSDYDGETNYAGDYVVDDGEEYCADNYQAEDNDSDDKSDYDSQNSSEDKDGAATYYFNGHYDYDYKDDSYRIVLDYKEIGEALHLQD